MSYNISLNLSSIFSILPSRLLARLRKDPVNAGTSATTAAPSITVTPSGYSGKTSTELEFERLGKDLKSSESATRSARSSEILLFNLLLSDT